MEIGSGHPPSPNPAGKHIHTHTLSPRIKPRCIPQPPGQPLWLLPKSHFPIQTHPLHPSHPASFHFLKDRAFSHPKALAHAVPLSSNALFPPCRAGFFSSSGLGFHITSLEKASLVISPEATSPLSPFSFASFIVLIKIVYLLPITH